MKCDCLEKKPPECGETGDFAKSLPRGHGARLNILPTPTIRGNIDPKKNFSSEKNGLTPWS